MRISDSLINIQTANSKQTTSINATQINFHGARVKSLPAGDSRFSAILQGLQVNNGDSAKNESREINSVRGQRTGARADHFDSEMNFAHHHQKLMRAPTPHLVLIDRRLSNSEAERVISNRQYSDHNHQPHHLKENFRNQPIPSLGEITKTEVLINHQVQASQFFCQGEVTTEDGRRIQFDHSMELQGESLEVRLESVETFSSLIDPLVLDLDGKGIGFEDYTCNFDLDGDGLTEDLAALDGGCGYLAFDQNGDGIINNGLELFGTQTGNGFLDLAAYDEDHNFWIDENDSIYNSLSVWQQDASGEDLLIGLQEANVGAISLAYGQTDFDFMNGNPDPVAKLSNTGIYLTEDGEVRTIHHLDHVINTETA